MPLTWMMIWLKILQNIGDIIVSVDKIGEQAEYLSNFIMNVSLAFGSSGGFALKRLWITCVVMKTQ